MTHVSKHKLHKRTELQIGANLVQTLLRLRGKRGAEVVGSLLTPTERMMLAKRIALIVLLDKGASYYRIAKTLRVSTSTIKRFDRAVRSGRYEALVRMIRGKDHVTFFEFVELLLVGNRSFSDEQRMRLWNTRRRLLDPSSK